MRDELITILLAGSDTTAISISWGRALRKRVITLTAQ